MREIKFRVWDKEHGMDYDPICGKSSGGPFKLNDEFAKADCVIMQYTGLKDMHGKKMYEKDVTADMQIVEWNLACGRWSLYKYELEGEFGASIREVEIDHDVLEELEIVGSIFELPILAEKMKKVYKALGGDND